jgi:hypothetical protein
MVNGRALARPSERSERFEPLVMRCALDLQMMSVFSVYEHVSKNVRYSCDYPA